MTSEAHSQHSVQGVAVRMYGDATASVHLPGDVRGAGANRPLRVSGVRLLPALLGALSLLLVLIQPSSA